MRHTFNIIQPSYNISQMIGRGLASISGYIISPDVLVGRLKEAKIKEWKSNRRVQNLGRMVVTTKISRNGSIRSISFSNQDPNPRPGTFPMDPLPLQFNEPDENGNILDEKTYEWLPMDEDFDLRYALRVSFFVILLCILFLYCCYCKFSENL